MSMERAQADVQVFDSLKKKQKYFHFHLKQKQNKFTPCLFSNTKILKTNFLKASTTLQLYGRNLAEFE